MMTAILLAWLGTRAAMPWWFFVLCGLVFVHGMIRTTLNLANLTARAKHDD